MKNEKRKIKNGKRALSIAFMFVLCSVLLVTGCPDPFTLDNAGPDIPEGKGAFSPSLSYSGRTILPNNLTMSSFAALKFTFTPQGGGTPVVETKDNSSTSQSIILDPGTYDLVVNAYGDANQSKLLARGTANGIVITAGQNTPAIVTLSALRNEGSGTFKWNITLPDNLTSASMLIKKGSTEEVVNLLDNDEPTSKTLSSGQYSVTINLEGPSGKVVWKELLYVYMNLESVFTKEFTNAYFINPIYTIAFDSNGGIAIDWEQSALHGNTISSPGIPTKAETPNVFGGWYKDAVCENPWNFVNDTVTGDITLYAKWNVNVNGDINADPTEGLYTGKDVLGNTYSLSLGSGAPSLSRARASGRAATTGMRYRMDVRSRDGKIRYVTGRVKSKNADGTLVLEPDGDPDATFTALVGANDVKTIAGDGDELPELPFIGDALATGDSLTPRTFDTIYLRASRWGYEAGSNQRGEHYGSGKSVLIRDFPTNVAKLEQGNTSGRYTITISGNTDVNLESVHIEIQGLTTNDQWVYLGGVRDKYYQINAGYFNETYDVEVENEDDRSYDLTTYKEVILQVTDVMLYEHDDHPEWTHDKGTESDHGIPDGIEDGTLIATISNFNIVLEDADRHAFAGNMPDFAFGIQEDGMSVDYRQAVWNLSPENLETAQKPGAIFEFVTKDVNIRGDGITAMIGFAWQDPDRGLWWQDAVDITSWNDDTDDYEILDGVEWLPWQHIIRIDLDKVIKDTSFKSANNANFIIALWWHNKFYFEPDNPYITSTVDDLNISGANIITPPLATTGNMGKWKYGYQENGISPELNQAVWHLPSDVIELAKEDDAALEIVFNKDNIGGGNENPHLNLLWQNPDTERWWYDDWKEATLGNWGGLDYDNPVNGYVLQDGVFYDADAKKLTVVLKDALESYDDFIDTTGEINFIITYGYTGSTEGNVNSLGMISANIISGFVPPQVPSAAISGSPVTVTATKANAGGEGAVAAETGVTINLTNATVKSALSAVDAKAYFSSTVAGLSYKASAGANTSIITIAITGTPTETSNETATIAIPGGVLSDDTGTIVTALPVSGNITYNIAAAPTPNSIGGNIGNFEFGYLSANNRDYQQACWYFEDARLSTLKSASTLELEFSTVPYATMNLAWQDMGGDYSDWHQTNILGATGVSDVKDYVVWDDNAKKLTITLNGAIADETDFQATTVGVKLIIAYYGPDNINDLGIVSANLVVFGEQQDGSYTLDPAGFTAWYAASVNGTTVSFANDEEYGTVYYDYPNGFDITDYGSLEIVYTVDNLVDGGENDKDGAQVTIAVYSAALGESNSGKDAKYTTLSGTESTLDINDDWNKDEKAFSFYWNSADGSKGFAIKVNSYNTDDTFDVTFHSITFKPAN